MSGRKSQSPIAALAVVLIAALLVGCGGASVVAPGGATEGLRIYQGPSASGQGFLSGTLVIGNTHQGQQYTVYEPGYTGTFTLSSSCAAPTLLLGMFAAMSYNPHSPPETASGPKAEFSIGSTLGDPLWGLYGANTCTFTVNDANGNKASVSATNGMIGAYWGSSSLTSPPAARTPGAASLLIVNGSPSAVSIYEAGYTGGFTLAAQPCALYTFNLQNNGPGSAMLTATQTGAVGQQNCPFAITDSSGQQLDGNAYQDPG